MMETYVLFGIGGMLSVIGFLIVRVLNGIESNISEIKTEVRLFREDVNELETDLHERVNLVERRTEDRHVDHEHRLSKVEARCAVVHRGE